MAVAGLQDPRGTAQQMIRTGFDVEFAKEYNPRARAAHNLVETSRKTSAQLETFHAANLAEINAPLMQRLVQAQMDGRLADGGDAGDAGDEPGIGGFGGGVHGRSTLRA